MNADILKRPSAFLPITMSVAALATVLIHLAIAGGARTNDEGASAHIFQLLIAGQVPIVAIFAVKWVPRLPAQAMTVFALQVGAALFALLPVYWLDL